MLSKIGNEDEIEDAERENKDEDKQEMQELTSTKVLTIYVHSAVGKINSQ